MGCLIGGQLVQAGQDVTFVARGRHCKAMQENGLTLVSGDKRWNAPVKVTDDTATLPIADIIFITVKSHQLPQAAPQIASLIGPNTTVVPALNGLPWWYFQKKEGLFSELRLESLDPKGIISQHIPADNIVGCVNYLAAHIAEPGVVEYVDYFAKGLVIGELDNVSTDRLKKLQDILRSAGLDPVVTNNIRESIWHKLWGNIAFNPISALTHATMDVIAADYDDTDLVMAVMNEARHIAEKLDIIFTESPQSRIAQVAKRKGHKTSMLQDIEAGRPTEIEAIVGAVREIALSMQEGTPYLNALYSLVKQKERFTQEPQNSNHPKLSPHQAAHKASA